MTADALPRIDSQYATGLSRSNIERALLAAGKDLNHLQVGSDGTRFGIMGR
jgi:hypothetical protein